MKENLARFKVPREIWFLDELPRNATGKVLKRELKELEAEQKEVGARGRFARTRRGRPAARSSTRRWASGRGGGARTVRDIGGRRATPRVDVGDCEARAVLPLAPRQHATVRVGDQGAALQMAAVAQRRARHGALERSGACGVDDRRADQAGEPLGGRRRCVAFAPPCAG